MKLSHLLLKLMDWLNPVDEYDSFEDYCNQRMKGEWLDMGPSGPGYGPQKAPEEASKVVYPGGVERWDSLRCPQFRTRSDWDDSCGL